ncbi:MAG TPA: hypothetical protein VKA79_16395 [Aestuariivirgaceae bacterium]|nr:hypothetical protein [Aestuariivirgaceae bacterium]
MRVRLIALGAAILVGFTGQGLADEPALVNCRLMKETTPWLFRQHCKSENLARLAVPASDDYEKPKKHKKYVYKKNIYKKKHALREKKKHLKEKLYWKIHYLEKKLYTELRECKTYKCKLIVKSKLAKLYSEPAYSSILPSAPSTVSNTFGSTTNAISGTTSSLGSTVGNTVSGTTNTLGGVTKSADGVVSGSTNTVGGVTQSAGGVVSGATNTVGGLLK